MNGFVTWMQNSQFHWLEIAVPWRLWVWLAHLADNVFLQKASGMGWHDPGKYVLPTGFAYWVFSFIVTYRTLGGFWLIVGVLLFGMGVFPLAVIGTMIRGLRSTLPDLLFAIAPGFVPPLCWSLDHAPPIGDSREVFRRIRFSC
jgi:hypothetical protein